MEHLTKAQIVLLTLFVSFVASMATGIVVVTLMEQASAPVSQTITNVVERTIEKITPTFIEKPGKQVIIKDEDLVVSAIDRNIKSVVAFKVAVDGVVSVPAGVGTIVSTDGLVVLDRGNFGTGVLTTTINGEQYILEAISNESSDALGIGRLISITNASSTPKFIAATLGDSNALRLGQTAIVIGGSDGDTVTTGLINNLKTKTIVDKNTNEDIEVIDSIGVSERFSGTSNGAPLITLDGNIVGFLSINSNNGTQKGVPASEAKQLLEKFANTTPSTE